MKPLAAYSSNFSTDELGFTASATHGEYFYFAELFNFSLPSDAPFFEYIHFYRYSKALGAGRVMYDMVEECAAPMALEEKTRNGVYSMDGEVGSIRETAEQEVATIVSAEVAPIDKGEEPNPAGEEAEPTLRENFNETAFFFPQLRANKDGSATFSFTMPDALTRWRLMLLAYTKDRKTGQNEYTFTSSKPVMIMADMPRYI